MRFGPANPSADQSKMRSVHSQYSSSVSPFHANTGTPAGASTVPVGPTATAAAASSCVEKMLQLAHRTCAPSATRVSISTAVCTVMWSEPAMRAPASGCVGPNSSRSAIRPGISFSARRIWWRPASARERSATRCCRTGAAVRSVLIPPFSHPPSPASESALGDRLVPHDDPPARHRHAVGVDRAQVVGVRIAARAERTQRRHLVAVVVGQGRDGLAGASHFRAESLAHRVHAIQPPGSRRGAAPRDAVFARARTPRSAAKPTRLG